MSKIESEVGVRCGISHTGYCTKKLPERLRCATPHYIPNVVSALFARGMPSICEAAGAKFKSKIKITTKSGDRVTVVSDGESLAGIRVNGKLTMVVDSGEFLEKSPGEELDAYESKLGL